MSDGERIAALEDRVRAQALAIHVLRDSVKELFELLVASDDIDQAELGSRDLGHRFDDIDAGDDGRDRGGGGRPGGRG